MLYWQLFALSILSFINNTLQFAICLPTTNEKLSERIVNITQEHYLLNGNQFNFATISFVGRNRELIDVVEYVTKIMKNSFDWTLQIIDHQFGIDGWTKNLNTKSYTINYAIMLISNEEDLIVILDSLLRFASINSATTILICTNNGFINIDAIAKSLHAKYIYKFIILATTSEEDISLYGLTFENRWNVPCFTYPSLKRIRNLTDILQPITFSNCIINVMAMLYPPYVINELEGLDIKILNEIERYFNITFNISLDMYANGWEEYNNTCYQGKLKFLTKNYAIGVGNVKSNARLENDFYLSSAYITEKMVWVVPIADLVPSWKIIFTIFPEEVWYISISIFVITSLMFYLLSFNKNENKLFRSIGLSITMSMQILVGNVLRIQPNTLMMRSIFISLIIFSMFLTTLYQSKLINYLTSEMYEPQIRSYKEIVTNGLEIGGVRSYRNIFDNDKEPFFKYIYKKYKFFSGKKDTAENWIKIVGDERKTATLAARFYVNYLIAHNNTVACTTDGKPKVYVMKNYLLEYPIRMIMPKRYVLSKDIDVFIGHLTTHGFIEYWSDRYKQEHKKSKALLKYSRDKSDQDVSLNVKHMNGAFFVLFCGYFFSIVAFILENIYYWIERKFSNKILFPF